MAIINASGKRKEAIARVALREGTGAVKLNGIELSQFRTAPLRLRISEPLLLIGEKASQVDIEVSLLGGGVAGQAEAARLAIARALVAWDETLKPTFEQYDRMLLVADVRRKEMRKPNKSRARAMRQKSYR